MAREGLFLVGRRISLSGDAFPVSGKRISVSGGAFFLLKKAGFLTRKDNYGCRDDGEVLMIQALRWF